MDRTRAVIVRTGTANLASVEAGLRRAGADCVLSEEPARVEDAERVVLPGVGTMKAAMERLEARGLTDVLTARMRAGRPTLAICLGLQLLFESSEESPGMRGLGVLPGRVTRLPEGTRTPHIGWNRVEAAPGAAYLASGYAYFAHSYRVAAAPPGWIVAFTEQGDRWIAALERGSVLACQFHPELSGTWGTDLLRRWFTHSVAAC